jgi:hypothetical protein
MKTHRTARQPSAVAPSSAERYWTVLTEDPAAGDDADGSGEVVMRSSDGLQHPRSAALTNELRLALRALAAPEAVDFDDIPAELATDLRAALEAIRSDSGERSGAIREAIDLVVNVLDFDPHSDTIAERLGSTRAWRSVGMLLGHMDAAQPLPPPLQLLLSSLPRDILPSWPAARLVRFIDRADGTSPGRSLHITKRREQQDEEEGGGVELSVLSRASDSPTPLSPALLDPRFASESRSGRDESMASDSVSSGSASGSVSYVDDEVKEAMKRGAEFLRTRSFWSPWQCCQPYGVEPTDPSPLATIAILLADVVAQASFWWPLLIGAGGCDVIYELPPWLEWTHAGGGCAFHESLQTTTAQWVLFMLPVVSCAIAWGFLSYTFLNSRSVPSSMRNAISSSMPRTIPQTIFYAVFMALAFQFMTACMFLGLGPVGLALMFVAILICPVGAVLRMWYICWARLEDVAKSNAAAFPTLFGETLMANVFLIVPNIDNATDLATSLALGWKDDVAFAYWCFTMLSTLHYVITFTISSIFACVVRVWAGEHDLVDHESNSETWAVPLDIEFTAMRRIKDHPSANEFIRSLRVPRLVGLRAVQRLVIWKLLNAVAFDAPLCLLDIFLLTRGFSIVQTDNSRQQLVVIAVGAVVRVMGLLIHGITIGRLVNQLQVLNRRLGPTSSLGELRKALWAVFDFGSAAGTAGATQQQQEPEDDGLDTSETNYSHDKRSTGTSAPEAATGSRPELEEQESP